MKCIVLVPLMESVRRPLHRRATSLLQPFSHCAASSPVRNSLYSCNRPVIGWRTALMASVSSCGWWYFLFGMRVRLDRRVGTMMVLAMIFWSCRFAGRGSGDGLMGESTINRGGVMLGDVGRGAGCMGSDDDDGRVMVGRDSLECGLRMMMVP